HGREGSRGVSETPPWGTERPPEASPLDTTRPKDGRPRPAPAPAPAPSRLGRFELIEAVGAGAFGTVYKARDPQLDRVVAVQGPPPWPPHPRGRGGPVPARGPRRGPPPPPRHCPRP